MRRTLAIACVVVVVSLSAIAGSPRQKQGTGPRQTPPPPPAQAAVADLQLDPSFAQLALKYLRSNDPAVLDTLAKSPAARHLLNHARNFDYDLPKDSTAALVASLVTPPGKHLAHAQACEQSLAFFAGPMTADRTWLGDPLRYLPDDFRFHGTLFLTFGYDIGVAFGRTASLNCAQGHFDGHPRELLYYGIHELHHVGFMAYQPPPKFSELKTCGDLLRLVQYSTQLEGMAVLAVYERRRAEHALNDDADYVALQDEPGMRLAEAQYFAEVEYLRKRAGEPADDAAWAVIGRMSGGNRATTGARLWYRVGALMARRIEEASGRAALVALVKTGPASFIQTYQRLQKPSANTGK